MTQINKENLQEQVAVWSKLNFGFQVSKFNGNIMGFNNPLLGIIEECGELNEADTQELTIDAISDIVIYSCDFCSRLGIELPEASPTHENEQLLTIVGDLCHAVLKTHQGIRGFEDQTFALQTINNSVARLLRYLESLCVDLEIDSPMELAAVTFQEVVSKRDWVKNPEAGV